MSRSLLVGLRNRSTSETTFRALDISPFSAPQKETQTLPDELVRLIASYEEECVGMARVDYEVYIEEVRIHWVGVPGVVVPGGVKFETDLYLTEPSAVGALLELAFSRGLGDVVMVEYNIWTPENGDTGMSSMYEGD